MIQAYEVGLTIDQFWRLTFHEYDCVCRGYSKRVKGHQRMLAWVTRNLMGCWVKNPPSIARLLGAKNLLGVSKSDIKEHYAGYDKKKVS